MIHKVTNKHTKSILLRGGSLNSKHGPCVHVSHTYTPTHTHAGTPTQPLYCLSCLPYRYRFDATTDGAPKTSRGDGCSCTRRLRFGVLSRWNIALRFNGPERVQETNTARLQKCQTIVWQKTEKTRIPPGASGTVNKLDAPTGIGKYLESCLMHMHTNVLQTAFLLMTVFVYYLHISIWYYANESYKSINFNWTSCVQILWPKLPAL